MIKNQFADTCPQLLWAPCASKYFTRISSLNPQTTSEAGAVANPRRETGRQAWLSLRRRREAALGPDGPAGAPGPEPCLRRAAGQGALGPGVTGRARP